MLEYETANPGQDAAQAAGEHFDPDLETANQRVSFATEDYAHHNGVNGNIGEPKEYGTDRRPFSNSPAPPHKNDQFAGLQAGGMHADELLRGGSESDQATLATRTSEHANPYSGVGNGVTGTNTNTTTHHNATGATRSAMKAGTTHNAPSPANGTERSARKNMYYNQKMNDAAERDEEYYDKV
jgi:aquaporin related protein